MALGLVIIPAVYHLAVSARFTDSIGQKEVAIPGHQCRDHGVVRPFITLSIPLAA